MIRYSLLAFFTAFILVYSWKNWYRAPCLLLPMVAILQRQDMPHAMFGVQGLNPFNIGLASIVVAWACRRDPKEHERSSARWSGLLIRLFVVVILVGFLRLFLEPAGLISSYSRFGLASAFLFNTLEWMVPGLLLTTGCRSKEDQQWAVWSVTSLYLILAIQTIRGVPLPYLLDGQALSERAGRVLTRYVGYHRVELAGVFAGASWAMLAARPLFRTPVVRLGLLSMSAVTVLALALTAGRMGYVAWCGVGLLVGLLRWPRTLVLGPIALSLLVWYAPGLKERLLQGFDVDMNGTVTDREQTDLSVVTSGRTTMWPLVLESILERPVFGYGRAAMDRNGLKEEVFRATGEVFGHPHNGYFQFALDNGLVGLAACLMLFGALLLKSAVFFRYDDPQAATAGGMAFVLLAAFLFAAVGAQTFYPTELSVGLWCAVGLLMRVSLQESRAEVAPAAVPHGEIARITKASGLRWRMPRPGRVSTVEAGGSGVAKTRRAVLPTRGARLPAANVRSRLRRWKAS